MAQVGGAWDLWLRHGLSVWAAIADSDFHNEGGDFWPCEFAATWVYAPDRTVDGVIRAMRAGSFFAEHGHIVSNVALQVSLAGLPRPAQAGETVSASVGLKATVSLHIDVSATDFLGRANRIDTVELIAISKDSVRNRVQRCALRAGSVFGRAHRSARRPRRASARPPQHRRRAGADVLYQPDSNHAADR